MTDARLGKLIARGGKLRADVADRVIDGTIDLTTTEVGQLTLTLIDDSDLNVLGSKLFAAGTPDTRGSRLDYGGLRFEVRAVEITERGSDHLLIVTARSLGGCRLRRDRGTHVWRNLSPTQFARARAADAGLTFLGQPSGKRKSIAREKGESSWDVITRVAGEAGFIVYEANGTLYMGKPSWLVEELDTYTLRWAGPNTADTVDALPVCRRSGDDAKRLATVRARIRGDAAEALTPGIALNLTGVPTFEDRYLIESVRIPLVRTTAIEVTAGTPIDPEKVDRPTAGGGGKAGDIGSTGTPDADAASGAKSAAAFVALALEQAGDTYIYGAEASVDDSDPNAFDCSELIQWAAGRVGVTFVDGSSAQIAACIPITLEEGIATRGALLWTDGHIAISLGDGRTIEAANPSAGVTSYGATGRFTKAGKIPGMRY